MIATCAPPHKVPQVPRGVEARPTNELLDHGRHVEGHAESDTPLAALPATDCSRGVAADLEEVSEGQAVTDVEVQCVGRTEEGGQGCAACVSSVQGGRSVDLRIAGQGSHEGLQLHRQYCTELVGGVGCQCRLSSVELGSASGMF